MSVVFNVRLESNQNMKLSLELLDDKNHPVDLSGVIAKSQVRITEDAEETVFSASSDVDESLTITDNNIILDVPFTTVAEWPIGTLYYDIVAEYAINDQDNIVQGKIILSRGVTR